MKCNNNETPSDLIAAIVLPFHQLMAVQAISDKFGALILDGEVRSGYRLKLVVSPMVESTYYSKNPPKNQTIHPKFK